MNNSEHHVNAWALRVFDYEIANGLHTPQRELYERLTDEEKIAYIMAGGVPSLLSSHHQHIEPTRTGSDMQTGQLPVLC